MSRQGERAQELRGYSRCVYTLSVFMLNWLWMQVPDENHHGHVMLIAYAEQKHTAGLNLLPRRRWVNCLLGQALVSTPESSLIAPMIS